MEGLLVDAEAVDELFEEDGVFVFVEEVLEGHEVRGFFEAEGELFGDEEEIVVVDFELFGLVGEGEGEGVPDLFESFVGGIGHPDISSRLHGFLYL